LNIYINITSGLVVYPRIIEKHIYEELPFMATENILMEAVKMGGDRQELHEKIRIHSMEAARIVKEQGGTNDLIDRICSDPIFNLSKDEVIKVLKPENYTGRASEQVEEFIREEVEPILESNSSEDLKIELNV
jgi:adenylosuccinate lyase